MPARAAALNERGLVLERPRGDLSLPIQEPLAEWVAAAAVSAIRRDWAVAKNGRVAPINTAGRSGGKVDARARPRHRPV